MKRFTDLAEAELTALSEDDIARYIDYACAENGVALLPALPPEPKPVDYEPDAKVYQLGYHWNFATAEDAARVLDAIKASNMIATTYLSTPSGITSTALTNRREALPGITVNDAFSAERAAQLKDELAGAKIAEDIYAKAKKEYDSAVAERDAYASEIREKVERAWETRHRREQRQRDYERYLDLADGNREIALRFLTRAHSDTQALLPDLFVSKDVGEVVASV